MSGVRLMLTFVVIALLVVVAFFAAATHDWLNGAPETPQALTEPEYVDPLEEEFRALEDAVLKRDDPAAWAVKHGQTNRYIQNLLASQYASAQQQSMMERYLNLPDNALSGRMMQHQLEIQEASLRQIQMQNAFYNRKAEGFLGNVLGGLGNPFASKKPPE